MSNLSLGNELDFAAMQKEKLEHAKREIDPTVPGYELVNSVGEGSMGTVYMVLNRDTNDHFAAKVVTIFINENLRRRITEEFEIHSKLKHENISRVYGMKSTNSYIVIFMELLNGGDLFDRIPIDIGMNTLKGFRIYKQLLDAVEYCHNLGIVHMDIKPENIMISNKGVPKLIDFGLAIDHNKRNYLETHIGTTAYSAPETFHGEKYTGYKADLFSLNITFLTLVTGQRCWTKAVLTDEHYLNWYNKKYDYVPKRLPTDLLGFLIGGLAHSPEERFSIYQIQNHMWYRNGLENKIKAVKIRKYFDKTNDFFPKSQPLNTNKCLNISMRQVHIDYDPPLSQPVDLAQVLMPTSCKNCDKADHIVKRMTRFFSTQNACDTFICMLNIIEQHHNCAISHQSINHVMVVSDVNGFQTTFRIFVYPFDESILVDFRRVRGDGWQFHSIFASIKDIALSSFNLVDLNHPSLLMVLPRQ